MRPPGTYQGEIGCGVIVVAAGLLLTLAGMTGAQQSQPVRAAQSVSSTDAQSPLQVHARKALATGKLAKWERNWYTKIVAGTVTPRRVTVWLTQYGPYEGYRGDDYHIAANPKYLPKGTVVWLPSTGRLMVVTNRGADFNDRIARKRGAAFWVDRWERVEGTYRTGNGDCWIVGRAPWRH